MKIRVTDNDIRDGKANTTMNCPVALALKRNYELPRIHVQVFQINLGDLSIPTPSRVRKFILAFDQGLPVNPFMFYLKVPKQ
jgi:hypothetical protein